MCAEAGVVVVFVPEIQNCRISGATFWAGPNRAVIALSDRYKKDDRFWFSFFHEAAHVLLHSKKETFVDDGSEAKEVLLRGLVQVNGEVETRRGRQLVPGDTVTIGDRSVVVGEPLA